jgi:predicted permease
MVGVIMGNVLPVGQLGSKTVLLLTAMPVATVTPLLSDYFVMDRDLISVSVVLSTVLALGTLPIVLSGVV